MPRTKHSSSKHRGRSSASPSPTTVTNSSAAAENMNTSNRWMNWQWQGVSDISMSGDEVSDMPLEYSESEDDFHAATPKYATGTSKRHAREYLQSSRIVRFQSSESLEEEEEQQPSSSRKSRSKQQQPRKPKTSPSRVWNAVSTLAHTVSRSPQPKRSPSKTKQYPHHSSLSSKEQSHTANEQSPLLKRESDESKTQQVKQTTKESSSNAQQRYLPPLPEERAIDIAAAFLADCERGQRPSLPADLHSISDTLLQLRRWKYSFTWQVLTHVACIALFISCAFESRNQPQAYGLNVFAIVVFVMDICMGSEIRKFQYHASDDPVLVLRDSRMEVWTLPMIVLLFSLLVEMVCYTGVENSVLWSGSLKPIALFYLSNKAKNALEAVNRIFRIVLRVLVMELFLILCFATVACQLYVTYDSFHDLSTSWLSLFQCESCVFGYCVS